MIRVLILDDHDLARFSISSALAGEPDIEIVGDTRAVDRALSLLVSARPQVAVVDIMRADGDGISAARQIKSAAPAVRLILLTDAQAVASTLLSGADGFAPRHTPADIAGVIRRICDGHRLLSDADVQTAHSWIRGHLGPDGLDGNARAGDHMRNHVLELMVAGLTDAEIVTEIPISQDHVDGHLVSILAMLHLPGARQAQVLHSHLTSPGAR
jgi:DNA-binding NarL/FixJ family response regulator